MITNQSLKAVIIDFDGTIVNSHEIAVKGHLKSIEIIGKYKSKILKDNINISIAGNYDDTINKLKAREPSLKKIFSDKSKYDEIKKYNDEYISSHSADIFPIIPYLFRLLHLQKTKILIYSSTSKNRITGFVKKNKCFDFIKEDNIIGLADFNKKYEKPDTHKLTELLSDNELEKSEVIYIGNSLPDYLVAKASSIQFYQAIWGIPKNYNPIDECIQINSLYDLWCYDVINTQFTESEDLIKSIHRNNTNFFAGAGFSLDAGLDEWETLVSEILKGTPSVINKGSLTELIDAYNENEPILGKQKILKIVNERLNKSIYQRKHFYLGKLNIERIWTINFDTLLENHIDQPRIITEDANLCPRDGIKQIIKINGSVGSINSEIILGESDFKKLFRVRKQLVREFESDIFSRTMLFVGTSFEDPLMTKILSKFKRLIKKTGVPIHYLFVKNSSYENYELVKNENFDGVSQIPMPSWNDILGFLAELNWKTNTYTAVISTTFNNLNVEGANKEFLFWFGYNMIKSGFNLRIGSGLGTSNIIIDGAFKACEDLNINHRTKIIRYSRTMKATDLVKKDKSLDSDRIDRLLSVKGSLKYVVQSPGEDIYNEMRDEMLNDADICISIAGLNLDEKASTRKSKNGMYYEKEKAIESNIPYLPLPFIDGFAQDEFAKLESIHFRFFSEDLRNLLQLLSISKDKPKLSAYISVIIAKKMILH